MCVYTTNQKNQQQTHTLFCTHTTPHHTTTNTYPILHTTPQYHHTTKQQLQQVPSMPDAGPADLAGGEGGGYGGGEQSSIPSSL